ncbi:hypothetical protein D3C83_218910 [compost metagenome]
MAVTSEESSLEKSTMASMSGIRKVTRSRRWYSSPSIRAATNCEGTAMILLRQAKMFDWPSRKRKFFSW